MSTVLKTSGFKISEIAKAMNAIHLGEDNIILGFSTDSRSVKSGDCFVAIKGNRVDGHQFIREVEAQGARCVLVNQKVDTHLPQLIVKDTVKALGILARKHREQFDIPVVAITGSCGKTTTKEMLYKILNEKGATLANQGNLNTEIGVPLTLLKLDKTHTAAIIEMGARQKGDIAYLMSLADPTISMITNAGVAHMEVFGTEANIASAKGEIYQNLRQDGIAVMNQDDKNVAYWKTLLSTQTIITFGFSSKQITCEDLMEGEDNTKFTLKTDIGTTPITLSVPGRHNVLNAMAAAAAARAIGIDLKQITSGLKAFKAVSGRMQIKKGLQGSVIIDDTYNANPVSMLAALSVLEKCAGKKIFVMGDMFELGSDTSNLHQNIGEEARKRGIHTMLGVGEQTLFTVKGFGTGAKHYQDKTNLIDALKNMVDKNTTVLIKGSRGMRMEEIVAAVLFPNQS